MRLLSDRMMAGWLAVLPMALVVLMGCGSGRTITSAVAGNPASGGTTNGVTTSGSTTAGTTAGTSTTGATTTGGTTSGTTTGTTSTAGTTSGTTTGTTTATTTTTGTTTGGATTTTGSTTAGATTAGSTTGSTTGGTTTAGTQPGVDFTTQIQPIFDQNCALSGCHASDTASGGMILDAGQSYANIVNVTSTEVPPEKRVAPGDSAHSYLYEKISHAVPSDGGQMPLGSNPLPSNLMALIKTWIDQGAKP
jgi:hypothetical protein